MVFKPDLPWINGLNKVVMIIEKNIKCFWMPNSKWAQPKEEDAKRKLKRFYTNSSLPREWASALKQTLIKDYSFESIANHYSLATKDFF